MSSSLTIPTPNPDNPWSLPNMIRSLLGAGGNQEQKSKKKVLQLPSSRSQPMPVMPKYKEQPKSTMEELFPQDLEDKAFALRQKMIQQNHQNKAILESLAGRKDDSLSSIPMAPQQQQPPMPMPQQQQQPPPIDLMTMIQILQRRMGKPDSPVQPYQTEAPVPYTGAD
jgi:hypothetical protein